MKQSRLLVLCVAVFIYTVYKLLVFPTSTQRELNDEAIVYMHCEQDPDQQINVSDTLIEEINGISPIHPAPSENLWLEIDNKYTLVSAAI